MNIDSIYVIVREIYVGSIYVTKSRWRSKPVIDLYYDKLDRILQVWV